MWNCKSSSFWPSESVLRNPGLSSEKALSSGARIVMPPDFVVASCEFIWLINWVVLRRRMNTLYPLACFKIPRMSTGGAAGVAGGWGNTAGGLAAGVAGADAGDWAKVEEQRRERTSESEMNKRDCFIVCGLGLEWK